MLLKCTGRRSTLNWLFRGRSIAGTQSVHSGTGSLLRLRRKRPTGFYIDISHRKNISTAPRPRSLSVLPTGRSCTAGPAKKRTRKKKRASRISLRTRLTAPTSSTRFSGHHSSYLRSHPADPFGHRFAFIAHGGVKWTRIAIRNITYVPAPPPHIFGRRHFLTVYRWGHE